MYVTVGYVILKTYKYVGPTLVYTFIYTQVVFYRRCSKSGAGFFEHPVFEHLDVST